MATIEKPAAFAAPGEADSPVELPTPYSEGGPGRLVAGVDIARKDHTVVTIEHLIMLEAKRTTKQLSEHPERAWKLRSAGRNCRDASEMKNPDFI